MFPPVHFSNDTDYRSCRRGGTKRGQHPKQDARTTTPPRSAVVVGRDGGYVRSRHRQEERHFEVVAGKVINATGTQRFAFAPTARRPPRTRSLRRLARRSRDARRHAGAVQGSCRILAAKREALPAATVAPTIGARDRST